MFLLNNESVNIFRDVPVDVNGDGTYESPYSICISDSQMAQVDFLDLVRP